MELTRCCSFHTECPTYIDLHDTVLTVCVSTNIAHKIMDSNRRIRHETKTKDNNDNKQKQKQEQEQKQKQKQEEAETRTRKGPTRR